MSNADKLFEFLKDEPYGRRLKLCLVMAGIPQTELCGAVGVSVPTLNKYIWGYNHDPNVPYLPPREKRIKIRDYICAEMPWLSELLLEEGDE